MAEVGELSTLADLKQDLENARAHNPRNIGMIERALGEVGAARSVVVDEDNVLLAGNGVYEAAAAAGIDNVQIVEADGNTIIAVKRTNLTPEQKKRLALFDNRTAELADWSVEQIVADLEAGLDLDGIFREDELSEMLEGFADGLLGEEPPEPQIDKAEELREKWGVELGQLWRIPSKTGDGEHRIVCGDCTDAEVVERVMEGEKVGAVVTDPPYGKDLNTDYRDMPKTRIQSREYDNVIGDQDDFNPLPFIDALAEVQEQFWWGGDYYYQHLPSGGSWLVWDKRCEASDGLVGSHFELCWSRANHRRRMIRHHWAGVNARNPGMERLHPTEKSVAVLETIVGDYTKPDDIVVDFFLGSGTTLVACERLGRFGRGIEISPGYVAVSLQRLADLGLQPERVGL